MNEEHLAAVDRLLLLIAGARGQAERSLRTLAQEAADADLVAALELAEGEHRAVHEALMRRAYFARWPPEPILPS